MRALSERVFCAAVAFCIRRPRDPYSFEYAQYTFVPAGRNVMRQRGCASLDSQIPKRPLRGLGGRYAPFLFGQEENKNAAGVRGGLGGCELPKWWRWLVLPNTGTIPYPVLWLPTFVALAQDWPAKKQAANTPATFRARDNRTRGKVAQFLKEKAIIKDKVTAKHTTNNRGEANRKIIVFFRLCRHRRLFVRATGAMGQRHLAHPHSAGVWRCPPQPFDVWQCGIQPDIDQLCPTRQAARQNDQYAAGR